MSIEHYQSELKSHQDTAAALYESALTLKINTRDEAMAASESLRKVKTLSQTLDARRKEITRPLDEAKKSVMALFKKPIEILERAEQAFKKSLLDFQCEEDARLESMRRKIEAERLEEERRLLEEQRKLAESLEPENIDRIREIAEARKRIEVERKQEEMEIAEIKKVEGVNIRELWKFEIVDITQVPREYLMPDEKKIQAVATMRKEAAQVAGVRFYSEKILVRRT